MIHLIKKLIPESLREEIEQEWKYNRAQFAIEVIACVTMVSLFAYLYLQG